MDAEGVVLVNVAVDLSGRDFVAAREQGRRSGQQRCQQQEGQLGSRLHFDVLSTESEEDGEERQAGVDKEHTGQDRTQDSIAGHVDVAMM